MPTPRLLGYWPKSFVWFGPNVQHLECHSHKKKSHIESHPCKILSNERNKSWSWKSLHGYSLVTCSAIPGQKLLDFRGSTPDFIFGVGIFRIFVAVMKWNCRATQGRTYKELCLRAPVVHVLSTFTKTLLLH